MKVHIQKMLEPRTGDRQYFAEIVDATGKQVGLLEKRVKAEEWTPDPAAADARVRDYFHSIVRVRQP